MTTDIAPQPGPDLPEIPAHQLESALRGHHPAECIPELSQVADLMNALRSPAERAELGGYHEAMNAFGSSITRPSPRSRRIAMLSSAVGLKALATSVGAAVAVGAVATVVLTSGSFGPNRRVEVLPVATTTSAAASTPANTSGTGEAKTGEPVGPDAKGPAAFGLCKAWSKNHGKTNTSVAHRNLARAAGGESKIAAYCATIPHPGASGAGKPATSGAKPTKAAKPVHPTKPPKPTRPAKTAKPTPEATRTPASTGSPTTSNGTATAPGRSSTSTPSTTAGTTTTTATR